MQWYDTIARIYDAATTRFYRRARIALIRALDIRPGDRVLIIACGTGQSFQSIEERIGRNGEIVAIDYSQGMLNVARKRRDQNRWDNITLLHADARDLSRTFLADRGIHADFDMVIGELAFSVIPEWQSIMDTATALLKDGGKFGLLDWYREPNDWLTRTIDRIAEAQTSRNTIRHAELLLDDFTITDRFFFGNVYVGTGRRKKWDYWRDDELDHFGRIAIGLTRQDYDD